MTATCPEDEHWSLVGDVAAVKLFLLVLTMSSNVRRKTEDDYWRSDLSIYGFFRMCYPINNHVM